MDDEDDLLDILGDEQALNSYLHGSSSKSDDGVPVGVAEGAEPHCSSSLQLIEDLCGASPSGVGLGDDQPFDILQKSLLEADITEQTLAQEALLESSPGPTVFPQQPVSGGGFEAGTGLSYPAGTQTQAFLQQPLQNGALAGQVQVLGAFDGTSSVMTAHLGLGHTGDGAQGMVFTPTPVATSIPLQNIIIQRGPPPQAVVRPIQPKTLSAGGQTVYSLGVQLPAPAGSAQTDHKVKVVGHAGSIVLQSSLGGRQQQQQAALPAGQFLLPTSLALTSTSSVLNGPALQTANLAGPTYSILTNQSGAAVQLVAGQGFSGGGQLIVNQGLISGQVPQAAPAVVQVAQAQVATPKTWVPNPTPTTGPDQGTLVNSTGAGPCEYANQTAGGGAPVLQAQQQISVNLEQHFLVPLTQGATTPMHTGAPEQSVEIQPFVVVQDSGFQQAQVGDLLSIKAGKPGNGTIQGDTQLILAKSSVPRPLTKGDLVLQHLQQDQARVLAADTSPFAALQDAIHRLLPYHVFQGASPDDDDFAKVDDEFESAAISMLNRTQEMLSKYRHLLLVEAERTSPSPEIVMIYRTFNQEERRDLSQDKRLALTDPEGFLEDFCCAVKPMAFPSSPYRTELRSLSNSPELNTSERGSFVNCDSGGRGDGTLQTSLQQCEDLGAPPHGRGLERPLPLEHSQPALADADSVLEAAVNSILEC